MNPNGNCPKCGSAVRASAAFCPACGVALSQGKALPPAADEQSHSAERRRSRWFVPAMLALAVLIAGAGAFAATRLISNGDTGSSTVASEPQGGSIGNGGFDDEAGATTTPDSGNGETYGSGAYGRSMEVFRKYWARIGAGRYASAYDAYDPGYATRASTSLADFVTGEEEYEPRVAMWSLRMTPRSQESDIVTLNVSLAIEDTTGPYAGECRLLSGWVRFANIGGQWYYRPGLLDGVKPSFATHPRVLYGDSRCPA